MILSNFVGGGGGGGTVRWWWKLDSDCLFSSFGWWPFPAAVDVIWPAVVGGGTAPAYATHAGDSSAHPSLYTHWCYASASCCILLLQRSTHKKGRAHQQRELLLALSFVPLLLLACIVATSPPTGCSSNVSPGQKVGGGTPSLSPTARSIVYTWRCVHIAKRGRDLFL